MSFLVKERGLAPEAADRLLETVREAPFLADASIRRERARGDSRIDFVFSIRAATIDRRLVCEVKSSGQPRIARETCLDLVDYARSDKRAYPVFIAPYISPEAASICEGYGVGYLDMAGNCRLVFDRVFIRREGYRKSAIQKRDLRSLYSPKAERVLRVLLTAGKRSWKMQELADEADVSLGQIANVKKILADREWIDIEPSGFSLRSLEDEALPMLKEWAANYRFSRNSPADYYSLKTIPQMEAELAAATQPVHEGRARKARGCDIAFDLFVETEISGVLPEGGQDQARVRVSSIVAFLVMKGMALHDRLKEKDAWDIYFTLTNYPGGLDALAQEIEPHVGQGLVREGLQKIAEKFASPDHAGPKFVADFEAIQDGENRAILMRDAFEKADYLLRRIGLR